MELINPSIGTTPGTNTSLLGSIGSAIGQSAGIAGGLLGSTGSAIGQSAGVVGASSAATTISTSNFNALFSSRVIAVILGLICIAGAFILFGADEIFGGVTPVLKTTAKATVL
jgi:hypothetical protein